MGFRLPRVIKAKQILRRSLSNSSQTAPSLVTEVPKGYLTVYVGDDEREMKRFVIPVSFLNQRAFRELLSHSEEEFGFEYPRGGLTIPCTQDVFVDIISRLS